MNQAKSNDRKTAKDIVYHQGAYMRWDDNTQSRQKLKKGKCYKNKGKLFLVSTKL